MLHLVRTGGRADASTRLVTVYQGVPSASKGGVMSGAGRVLHYTTSMKTSAVILASSLAILGCDDERERCIVTSVDYAGAQDGPVYVVGTAADGSGRTAERSPSIAVARATAGESCAEGKVSKAEWTFQAWIDVTGEAAERCASLFGTRIPDTDASADPERDAEQRAQCAPLQGDPQVTVTRTLGEGRSRIELEIEDR